MQVGRGFVNHSPCSPEDEMENWQRLFTFQTFVTNLIDGGEFTDTFKTRASSATVEGFLDEVLTAADENVFDGGSHTPVYWQVIGNNVRLFIDSAAGGDTYQVKVSSGGAAGFLDTKIHADTWEPTDTYNSGTHFITLAASVSDAVRFYSPYAIIKTNAGDGSPNYLHAKFEPGTWIDSDTHVQCLVDNLGGALRIFFPRDAIELIINALLALGEYVEVVAITSAIAAPTWNASTAKLTPTDCEFPVFYPHSDNDGTWTIDEETTTQFKSFLKVTIDAPATGKYRRGIVVGGKLTVIQCEEEDLPTGWGG